MKVRGLRVSNSFPVSSGAVDAVPAPERVVLPLATHWGELSPSVQVGEAVKWRQCIARGEDLRLPPLHASVSGTVEEIKSGTGPRGRECSCVVIRSDNRDESEEVQGLDENASPREILDRLVTGGIREADAGRWPLALRLASPDLVARIHPSPREALTRPVETLVVNAMDRQPWVSVRQTITEKRASELLESLPYLQKVSGAKRTVLAASTRQFLPEALERGLRELKAEVVRCPDRYPAALEPLLVQRVTGRQVPQPLGDARKVNAVVVDVTAALRVLDLMKKGCPPTETLVDVVFPETGLTQIVRVREGMLVEDLVNHLQPKLGNIRKAVLGGPFLGYAQPHLRVPLTMETDSLLLQAAKEVSRYDYQPCINCGNCVHACPMRLLPNELSKYCEFNAFEEAERSHLFHCIECGICAYVCPSRRPMVQLMRFGKQEIEAMRVES